MRYLFIAILILIKLSFCSCQEYVNGNNKSEEAEKNEEENIKSNLTKLLEGTTILPWTRNQQIAKGYGLYLDSVKISECDKTNRPPEFEEITSVSETDSTLIIEAKIIGNCCHDFLCDVEIVEEQTINLIKYGYGNTYCSCTCCYGITYKFSIMKVKGFGKLNTIILNGEERTKRRK